MLASPVHLKIMLFCHYWYFLDKVLKFQSSVCCNRCHDPPMVSIDINSIATWNNHGIDYRCSIAGIRKSEVINSVKHTDLSEKSRSL